MIRPSNSPSVLCAGHAKSQRPIRAPRSSKTSNCSTGSGSPAELIRIRLKDSPTLSLRPSATAIARRACPDPCQRWACSRHSARSPRSAPALRLPSATATAWSYGSVRARSTAVRANEVMTSPSATTRSCSLSGEPWTQTTGRRTPPPRRSRVRWTWSTMPVKSGSPSTAAAEPWLIAARGCSCDTVASIRRRCGVRRSYGSRSALRPAPSATYAPRRIRASSPLRTIRRISLLEKPCWLRSRVRRKSSIANPSRFGNADASTGQAYRWICGQLLIIHSGECWILTASESTLARVPAFCTSWS